jgi:hypothetical protein
MATLLSSQSMATSPDNTMEDFNDSSVDLSTIRAVAVSIASAEQREREVIRREDLERAFSDGKVYWQKEDLTRKSKPLAFPPLPYNGTVLQSNDVVDEPCEDGRDSSSDRTRVTPHSEVVVDDLLFLRNESVCPKSYYYHLRPYTFPNKIGAVLHYSSTLSWKLKILKTSDGQE